MANLVWLPIADKLKTIHAEERRYLEMVLEGAFAIHAGEIPSTIRTRLSCMLSPSEQEKNHT
jgi:flagellar motor component MotA